MKGNSRNFNGGNRGSLEFVEESSSDDYDSDDYWFSSADDDDYGEYDDEVPGMSEEFKGEHGMKIKKMNKYADRMVCWC